jgi:hypothetical protein
MPLKNDDGLAKIGKFPYVYIGFIKNIYKRLLYEAIVEIYSKISLPGIK